MRCKARVCGECTTKIDGINHCVDCLAVLGGKASKPEERVAGQGVHRIAGILWFGFLSALVWMLLEVALPGSGLP